MTPEQLERQALPRIDTLQVPQSSLQPVKHPDTVRLDFMIDHLLGFEFSSDNQEYEIFQSRIDYCVAPLWACEKDARAAIDTAIEMQKNESEKS